MSGIYEFKREPATSRRWATRSAPSATSARPCSRTIGVLAALRHRDRTGEGQHVDVAMLDAVVAMTDIVTNFWSMGLRGRRGRAAHHRHGFRAADGWFVLQVGREPQFAALVELVGRPEWVDDPRFATRQGWIDHLERRPRRPSRGGRRR